MELQSLFDDVEKGLTYMYANPYSFPVKQSIQNSSGVYFNILAGRLEDGTFGSKSIYVNEYTKDVYSTTHLVYKGQDLTLDSSRLTTFRCALLAAYVLYKELQHLPPTPVIGILGVGRINKMTIDLIETFAQPNYVFINGTRNPNKGLSSLTQGIADRVEIGLGNASACDVLLACTSNNDVDELYTIESFPNVSLTIAQDGGYTLDNDFRENAVLFSDYPKQIQAHIYDEFPHGCNRTFNPLTRNDAYKFSDDIPLRGYYLYGTALMDILVAQWYIDGRLPLNING